MLFKKFAFRKAESNFCLLILKWTPLMLTTPIMQSTAMTVPAHYNIIYVLYPFLCVWGLLVYVLNMPFTKESTTKDFPSSDQYSCDLV